MTERLLSDTQTDFDDIRENYARICDNIQNAMAASSRTDKVRLMAVTKTVDCERINFAVGLGVGLLGENRVQEFMDKRGSYAPAEVHFIGGLQTNKVKYIIDKVSMIHSVDSLHLAEEISRRAEQHGVVMDILAEVNIGGEETKGGVAPREIRDFCKRVSELSGIRLRGLMTIPPPGDGEKSFARMQEIYLDIRENSSAAGGNAAFDTLSMGMSGDYEAAVKYGSTIVRIGSALFGYRKYI